MSARAALVLVILMLSGVARADAVATAATFSTDDSVVRVTIEMTAEPSVRSFVVPAPNRLVIDLQETRFDLGEPGAPAPAGMIAAWRYGTLDETAARIVFDLSAPALLDKEFFLPPLGGQPGRLVLEFVAVSPAEFEAAASAGSAVRQNVAAASVDEGPVIVIDPGHGGIDPGAITPAGLQEKDVVFAFAQRLKEQLDATGRFRVRLTRTDDRFLSLSRRIRIARAFGADLFISVHADAAPQDYVRGATVYTLSERPSDAQAAAVAARENLADTVSGVIEPALQEEVSGILADLMRRETKTFSHEFAKTLIAALEGTVTLNSRPHRSARFRVLMAHDFPSVLFELGYLTNETDVARLKDAAWREAASSAVTQAVQRFFDTEIGSHGERALLATRQR